MTYHHLADIATAIRMASTDLAHRAQHLDAALSATGSLQRELLMQRLATPPPTQPTAGNQ